MSGETNNKLIQNFDQFFIDSFGKDKKLINYKATNLTAPGENYGSLMLAVEITYKNENNSEETIQTVAKMTSENEFVQKMFQPQFTFKKEREIYNTAVPTLRRFFKEYGVNDLKDLFPKLFGSRLNLLNNNSEKVDADGIILLENLKVQNYKTLDRLKGFNLVETKFAVENLAEFHTVPIALKLLKPKEFKEKILPHLGSFPFLNAADDDMIAQLIDNVIDEIKRNKEFYPHLAKIRKALEEGKENVKTFKAQEPFGTWVHNDYWVNNTMIKFDDNNNNIPIENKIVDYQVIEYNSPAKDLIFFLFTSVDDDVLVENYEELIKLYYDKFISVLKKFDCDTILFTFKQLQKEIDLVARKTEFFHIILMLPPLFLPSHQAKDANELSIDDMMKNESHIEYKQKLRFTVLEFVKRNWI